MRKLLLAFSCLVVFANNSQAQINLTTVFDKHIAMPRPAGSESSKDLLAITKTGDLYAVGNFETEFNFATSTVTPIAKSMYIIKYDAAGIEKWGVSIQGAATPTSITTDDAGNLYVAGTFADQITIGTTSGSAENKTALAGDQNLQAAFIAKYSPEGVILKSAVYVPTSSASVTGESPSVYFNDLKINNGVLYGSLLGKYNNLTNNNIILNGGYIDYGGWSWFIYNQFATIVSLNENLNFSEVIASINSEPNLLYPSNVNDATICFDTNGKLYLSTATTGDLKITVGSNSTTFTNHEDGKNDFEYIIAAINLNDKSFISKKYVVNNVSEANFTRIKNSFIYNDKLILAGIFNEKLAFDNNITAVKRNDIFATALSLSDLSVAWAKSSGIDEVSTANEEVLTNSVITGNRMILAINTKVSANGTILTSGTMECDLATGTLSAINNNAAGEFVTGIASKSNYVAKTKATSSNLAFTMSKNENAPTGVINTEQDNGIKVYPTVTSDCINFTEPCNVSLRSISGAIIQKATDASSLNVASLESGIYFVTVTNEKGTQTTKVIKK